MTAMWITRMALSGALLGMGLFPVSAAQAPDVFTFVMIADVVQPASCSLNSGQDVSVSFGEQVNIDRVNGSNYKVSIDYNLRCESLGKNTFTLEIDGAEAEFGNGLLQVMPGFAVQILKGDSPQPINTPFTIDGNSPPELMAVPVKKDNEVLTLGPFEATAIIKVIYE